jgi:hypothetical protein
MRSVNFSPHIRYSNDIFIACHNFLYYITTWNSNLFIMKTSYINLTNFIYEHRQSYRDISIIKYMRGKEGSFYSRLEWLMGSFLASFKYAIAYLPCPSQIHNHQRLLTLGWLCVFNSHPNQAYYTLLEAQFQQLSNDI